MKKLLLILIALPMIGFGQVATPSVLASSGDSYANGNVIMDVTLGEIVVQTHTNGATILTQGFHQGELRVSTSVENIEINTKVYPNPTTQYLIIELEKNVNAELMVYDITGKLVLKDKLIDQQRKELDFSFLTQGNYLLHINIADKQSVYQINKTK